MQQQPKPLKGSLKDLGLQRFMDERYYKYGGYVKLVSMFEDNSISNAEIGRAFGPGDRPVSRQAVADWRVQWESEK